MKILALLLIILGSVLSYGAKKIVPYVFKNKEITDSHITTAKLVGFTIVVIAAVIVFKL